MTAVLFLLGGLVQINPIWEWGPFETALSTNGAQPDWYLGWLIGALRVTPGIDVAIGDVTLIPNAFWGGLFFPMWQIWAFRVAMFVLPFVVGRLAYVVARELAATELHPLGEPVAKVVRRTPSGGFQAEEIRPGSE
jgi:hypothetical protein